MRKLYDRLQRNERNRIAATAAAMSASSDVVLPQGGARVPPPSFVPPPRAVSPAVAGTAGEEVPAAEAAAAGLDNGDAPAAGAPVCGPVSSDASSRDTGGCCRGGGDGGSDGGSRQSALQVGERLSDAVRLCSSTGMPRAGGTAGAGEVGGVRGGDGGGGGAASGKGEGISLYALTLSEAELSQPRRLLDDLRFVTCRPSEEAAGAAQTPPEAEERNDFEGAQSMPAAAAAPTLSTAVEQGVGFLSLALAQEEVGRADALASGYDPLMETAWLAERFPKVTLGDLLANRVELSLWASYWNRQRRQESVG